MPLQLKMDISELDDNCDIIAGEERCRQRIERGEQWFFGLALKIVDMWLCRARGLYDNHETACQISVLLFLFNIFTSPVIYYVPI